jgi:hypothetical protein
MKWNKVGIFYEAGPEGSIYEPWANEARAANKQRCSGPYLPTKYYSVGRSGRVWTLWAGPDQIGEGFDTLKAAKAKAEELNQEIDHNYEQALADQE